MAEVQEIDVEQLMERIRQDIRRNHASTLDDDLTAIDLSSLHATHNIQDVPLASHRGLIGVFIVSVKKTLRKLLTPILQRQVAYNDANIRVTMRIKEHIGALDGQQAGLVQTVETLTGTLEQGQTRLSDEVRTLRGQLRDELLGLQTRLGDEVLPSQGQLRDELLGLQTQLRDEMLTSQGQLREQLLELQTQLRDEVLIPQGQLREQLLELQTQLRDEVLIPQGQLREQLLELQTQLRDEVLIPQGQLQEQLRVVQSRLTEELEAHALGLDRLRQAGTEVTNSVVRTERKVASAERKLRRILHVLRPAGQPQGSGLAPSDRGHAALRSLELEPEFDYAGFEDQFRGGEEEIKERQRTYVPYFKGRENILDIGCGRGELLELLGESGITARGLDLDLDMVLLCREKGLAVTREDAFAHLEALPDDSLGGVFAAQVIEHLHSRRIIELVKLCHRKLSPGGLLILETPNPACLVVFAASFYRDLSHIQPIHPDTMAFLLGATGFHNVELKYSSPVEPSTRIPPLPGPGPDVERFNQGIERLNSLLFGFQDYAVIGQKGFGSIFEERASKATAS